MNRNLARGIIDENSLYITTKKNIEDFYPSIYKNKLNLRYLNNYYLIFKGKSEIKEPKSNLEIKKAISVLNNTAEYNKILKI